MALRSSGRDALIAPVAVGMLVMVVATGCASSPTRGADPALPSSSITTAGPPTDVVTAGAAFDPEQVDEAPAAATTGPATAESLTTADGRTRTFHTYVPASVDTSAGAPAMPLLVALHGGTGSGLQYERSSGFDGLAEANGFMVVYPDAVGIGDDGTELRTWNGGQCCGPAATQGVDDVAFVDQLIGELEDRYPVDSDRVFAAGHSNGAILAYRLACELSDDVAAIGVQAGTLGVEGCDPARPVSVLHIHGTDDQNLPVDGGVGPDSLAGVDFSPPRDGLETLARADHCTGEPVESTAATDPDLMVTQWTACADGATVAFLAVTGASHAWMGSAAASRSGAPYPDLDASLQIWSFLSTHGRT